MADRRSRIILGLDADPYIRGLTKAAAATSAFTKQLDSSDSRMGNLVQSALALGPALVPIGAAAVPAVTSLTASLGAAAGAAAVALVAFNGVGDGLKALNDYQLERTPENFKKVQQALRDLGPAGANFVLFLDELEPKLDRLQNTARAGLFPGVEAGIRALMTRAPQVNQIIANLADAMGDLAQEGGAALSSEKFDDFFNYMETQARPILMDMGRTLGNFTEGLANMLIAFDPLSDAFSKGLLGMSRDFAKWSRDLDNNEGFQNFVEYIERVSPAVVDTLGSLVGAIADIVSAAAPVGEVTLPIIKALAEALSAVANSPAGPALIAAAAGISAVSRGVALYKVANGSALLGMLSGAGKEGKKANVGFRTAAAGVGVLALSLTDVDESLGLSNTAMGVAIGTMAGPWGAAIGGAIGAAKDLWAANNDIEDSLKAVSRAAANPQDVVEYGKAVRAAVKETTDALNDAEKVDTIDWLGGVVNPGDAFGHLKEFVTGDLEEASNKAKNAERAFNEFKLTLSALFAEVRKGGPVYVDNEKTLERMAKVAVRAGVSLKGLKPNTPEWLRAAAQIRDYNRQQDGIPGRAASVRGALKKLEDPLYTNAEAADELEGALSALFDPQLNAREALIEWKNGLVELRKQIKGTNGSLNLNTKAGRNNQSAIIGQIRNLKAYATAEAERTGNTKRATRILRDGRKSIIQAGVAAGISRKDMKRLANQMGLVPNVVSTKVKTPGSKKSKNELKGVDGWARTVKDHVSVNVSTPGSKKSWSELHDVDNMARTAKDRLSVNVDTPGSKKSWSELHDVDKMARTAKDRLSVKTDAPGANKTRGELQGVDKDIRNIDGKKVNITLNTKARNIVSNIKDIMGSWFADGGIVKAYANGGVENHVAQIAPAGAWRMWAEPETGGEAYIPLAASKRPRSRAIAAETVSRLGGDVQWNANGNITLDTRPNVRGNPRKDVARIDQMYTDLASVMSSGISKAMSKALSSMGSGFHWPLPRKYGYSGSWGSYASGGSHPALDFPAPLGTPIYATLPGRVASVRHMNSSYGNHVVLNHGRGLESISAHMAQTAATEGDTVTPGQTIGYVDSTGNSTGNHLHLELRRNGSAFNFTNMLNSGGIGMGPVGVYDGDHSGLNQASPGQAKSYAKSILGRWGWGPFQWPYWEDLGNRESGWRWNARNPSSGAYGIPQSLPPEKLASAGPDWRTNAGTQIDWMAGYIKERYGGPYGAIQWHNSHNWYGDGGIRNGSGINVFDQGGIWKSGTIGVNLSGRDEYVNDPQATAAAVKMANGGLIDGFGFGSRKRLGSASGQSVVTVRTVPGSITSFIDLLKQVGKPDTVHNIQDLNKAWRNMRRETRELDREENQLRRLRRGSRATAKAVKESERDLEVARKDQEKSGRKVGRIEDRLKRARQATSGPSKDVAQAERALVKARQKANHNGKVTRAERLKIVEAEKALKNARQDSAQAGGKVNKLERQLRQARNATIKDDRQIARIRERLHRQRKRAKVTGKDIEQQEKAVEKQRKKLSKATERWKNVQQELLEQAKAVSDAITKQGDVFGGQGTSNTAQGLLSKLRGAGNQANQFRRLYQNAVRRGVDRDILDQILEQGSTPEAVNLLSSLAAAPDALIKRINRQENRLQNIADRVGTWTTTRQGQGRFAPGTPGRQLVQNFNGPIYTQDPKAAAREIEARWRKGLLVAKGA